MFLKLLKSVDYRDKTLLDSYNNFGNEHFIDPRQISLEKQTNFSRTLILFMQILNSMEVQSTKT